MRITGLIMLSLAVSASFSASAEALMGDVIKTFAAPNIGTRGLAWDGAYIWYADSNTDIIYKLNPGDGSLAGFFSAPGGDPADLTFVGGELWNVDYTSGTFYSVNPGSGPPWASEFTKAGDDYYGLAYDGSFLWGSDPTADMIRKMDLSGNVISSIPAPGADPRGIAWDGTYLWVANDDSDPFDNTIFKIDPVTGNVIDSFASPDIGPTGLTFDGQYLWGADNFSNQIYQVDAGYSAPVGATPAPPGLVTLLSMLGALGGARWLRWRKKNDV